MKSKIFRIRLALVATSSILATAGCGNSKVGDLVRTAKGQERTPQFEPPFTAEDANGTWKTGCVLRQTHTLILDHGHMTHDAIYGSDDTCKTKHVAVHQTGRLVVGDPDFSTRRATVDQLTTSIVPESSGAVTLYDFFQQARTLRDLLPIPAS